MNAWWKILSKLCLIGKLKIFELMGDRQNGWSLVHIKMKEMKYEKDIRLFELSFSSVKFFKNWLLQFVNPIVPILLYVYVRDMDLDQGGLERPASIPHALSETHPRCATVRWFHKIKNVDITRRTGLPHIGDLIQKCRHALATSPAWTHKLQLMWPSSSTGILQWAAESH